MDWENHCEHLEVIRKNIETLTGRYSGDKDLLELVLGISTSVVAIEHLWQQETERIYAIIDKAIKQMREQLAQIKPKRG